MKKTLDFLKFICYDIDTIKKTGTLMKVGDKVRIYDNNPHTDCCYGVAVILKIEKIEKKIMLECSGYCIRAKNLILVSHIGG